MASWLSNKGARLRWRATNLVRDCALAFNWLRHGRHYGARRSGATGVVVSLTSYPPRYPTLHLTLKSLLSQSFMADRVVLWVAHHDHAALPAAVTALQSAGLEIRTCDDLRSYKKMIPLLQETLACTVVTADDDVYYWRDWLAQLANERQPGKLEVICHRMHRIKLAPSGQPAPYNDWQFEADNAESSNLNFPTGIGGTLYPAGVFGPQVLDRDTFMALCPRGDDIWFWWMARSRGATFRRSSARHEIFCWDGSQDVALWKDNVIGRQNDDQINAMIAAYGFFNERNTA